MRKLRDKQVAANEIKLTLRVDDNGSLNIVAKEAKKAAKGIDELDKSGKKARKGQDRFDKGLKGVAGSTSNSTKAFSKMRNEIGGGSSGLVGAYAVLAANLFAATAAFGVLKRAAQFDELVKGLEFVGNAAGTNLTGVADRLKDITGAALSTEQALRATALAVSAGIKTDQLEQLTKIAKGASLALGRDMGDALDRLVRGTAKLEPEILDELGIMVRLDDATQSYADKLDKTVGSLTNFERRQAFLNGVLEQGTKKYGEIAGAIDTNAYDKLSASLSDLAQTVLHFLNDTLRLADGIAFLSENITALAVAATTLGLGLTRQIAPALFNLDGRAAASAAAFSAQNIAMLATIDTAGKMPKKYKDALEPIVAGVGTLEDYEQAQQSLTNSDTVFLAQRKKLSAMVNGTSTVLDDNKKAILKLGKEQKSLTKIQELARKGDKAGIDALIKSGKITTDRRTSIGKLVSSLQGQTSEELKSSKSLDKISKAAAKTDNGLAKLAKAQERIVATTANAASELKAVDSSLASNAERQKQLAGAQDGATKSSTRQKVALASQQAAQGKGIESARTLTEATKEEAKNTKTANKGKGKAVKALGALKVAYFAVGGAARAFGSAVASFIPYIGIIITLGTVLYSFLKDKFFPEDVVQKRIEDASKSFEKFGEIQRQFMATTVAGGERMGNAYIAYAGVLDTIKDAIVSTASKIDTDLSDSLFNLNAEILISESNITLLRKAFDDAKSGGINQGLKAKKELLNAETAHALLVQQRGVEEEKATALRKATLGQTLGAAVKELTIRKNIADRSGKQGVFNLARAEQDINILSTLSERLKNATSDADVTEILQDYDEMSLRAQNISLSFKSIEDAVTNTNSAISKEFQKQKLPFEDMLSGLNTVTEQFTFLEGNIASLQNEMTTLAKSGVSVTSKQFLSLGRELASSTALLDALESELSTLKLGDKFKDGSDGVKRAAKFIVDYRERTAELRKETKELTISTAAFVKVAGKIAGADSIILEENNALYQKQLDLVKEDLAAQRELFADSKENSELLLKLGEQEATLQAKIMSAEQIRAVARRNEIAEQDQLNKLAVARNATASATAKLMNDIREGSGGRTETALAITLADIKIQAAQRELEMARLRLEIERAILEAQFMRADSDGGTVLTDRETKVLELLDKQLGNVEKITQEKIKQATIDKLSQLRNRGKGDSGGGSSNSSRSGAIGGTAGAIIDGAGKIANSTAALDEAKNMAKEVGLEIDAANDKLFSATLAGDLSGMSEQYDRLTELTELKTATDAVVNDIAANLKSTQSEVMSSTLAAAAASITEALGPQGEVAASALQGLSTINTAINASRELRMKFADTDLSLIHI